MKDLIQLSPEVEVAHIGPPLDKGPLPAVFYFALSANESLELDPYNQPALYLKNAGLRVFSIDLPAHGPNLNALDAIGIWAAAFQKGEDLVSPFIDKAVFAIQALIDRGLILRERIGLMGLSRGGLIAAHVATKFPEIKALCGFAPMTEITYAKELQETKKNELASALNLIHLVDPLCETDIRFYIGNRDQRVGTDKCFSLVEKLTEASFEKGNRSPSIEMIISPSIGHMGHGTSKQAFEAGADWVGRKLGAIR